jgi:endonuclease YncB( thermonuclease family)
MASFFRGLCVIVLALLITLVPALPMSVAAQTSGPFPFPDYTAVDYTQIPIQETGVVDVVADGDTIRFIPDGASDYVTVRLLGINTPEVRGFYNQNRSEDMCGAVAATELLSTLLPPGWPVQLRSLSSESRGSDDRLQRYAFAWNPTTGAYDIDVQAAIASAGLAMWFTVANEAALSYPYAVLTSQAQLDRRGIWNPEFCGPIEQPDASISVIAHWNAGGNDNANPNGEYMIVRNTGGSPVDLTGWLLRDSSLSYWFTFPGGSILAPDDYRVVHIGPGIPGQPNPRDLYMGSPAALLANTSGDRFTGDGVYLLDRSTAMRTWFEWPCVLDCTDPAQGVLRITEVNPVATAKKPARAANQEYIVLENRGPTEVNLDGYYLAYRGASYPFLVDSRISPGRKLTVFIGKGQPTRRTQYWGRQSPLLQNKSGTVELLSERNVVISRKTW